MKNQGRKVLKALILIACMGGFAPMSFAIPIVQTAACVNNAAATCATGVTGLDVSGTLYNVIFSQSSYNDLFTGTPPAFLGNSAGAIAAANALVTPLNGAGIVGVLGDHTAQFPTSMVHIPFFEVPSLASTQILYYGTGSDFSYVGEGSTFPGTPLSDNNSQGYSDSYAVFTPARIEVPVPSVLALMGLGLMGIRLTRRNRSLPV